jgi:hypothetical protein
MQVDDIARCVASLPERMSPASNSRDDHRVFWRFEGAKGESFDDALSRAVKWAHHQAELLSSIDDVALSLWCEVHSDSEFAGLALQAVDMKRMGDSEIDLLISVYAQPEVK